MTSNLLARPARRVFGPAVLIVESDFLLATHLENRLAGQGYRVEVATTAASAFDAVASRRFSALVIDFSLLDGSGVELTASLRRDGFEIPIVLIAGHHDPGAMVIGLDAGADDYLVRPAQPDLLEARLRALHRRWRLASAAAIEVGDLVLEPSRLILQRGDTEIELTPVQASILGTLMTNVGVVLNRDQLAAGLSGLSSRTGPPASNVIDVHIRALRAKIDGPFGSSSIETVRGMGYRFAQSTTSIAGRTWRGRSSPAQSG